MTSKLRGPKHLQLLQKESKKLHGDVEDLENALILHQRFQEVDENSVRGILRKEIGGSRWEHGGAGKLNSYRGVKDLNRENSEQKRTVSQNPKRDQRNGAQLKGNSNKNLTVDSKQLGFTYNVSDKASEDTSQVSGRKRREKECAPTDDRDKRKKQERGGKEVPITMDTFTVDKVSDMKAKVLEKVSSKVIWRKKNSDTSIKDISAESETKSGDVQKETKSKSAVKKEEASELRVPTSDSSKEDRSKTVKRKDLVAQKGNVKPSRELYKETKKESPKQTNRIDPELLISKNTTSLSEVSKVHDGEVTSKNFNSHSSYSSQSLQKELLSKPKDNSPSPTRVKCDPSVYMWLKRLALLEEEKYIDMFARNEIDLSILITLDEKQLEKMGVLALGAMKKLLAGIEELKQKKEMQPVHQDENSVTGKSSPKTRNTEKMCPTTSASVKSKSEIKSPKTPESSRMKDSSSPFSISSTGDEKPKDRTFTKPSASVKRSNSISQTYTKVEAGQNFGSESQRNSRKVDKNSSARPRESSLTRGKPSKGVLLAERPQSSKARSRKQKSGPNLPRANSAKSADVTNKKATELVNKKAEEGIKAALKRSKIRQEPSEERLLKEQNKYNRDEMAARHIEREKKKREESLERMQQEEEEARQKEMDTTEDEEDSLEDLVKVINYGNTVRPTEADGEIPLSSSPQKRPLYRPNPSKPPLRQSMAAPISSRYLHQENQGFSSNRNMSSRHSYSSRTNTVKDIEKQINTLTKKAMAGDTVTMDLVKDLQKRLEELETQIKSPPDNSVAGNRRSKSRYVGQGDANLPFSDLEGGQRSRKMTGSGSQKKGGDFEELKQERKQHRSELRQLQSELSRIRHNDPIRSVEISIKDLDYDESDVMGEGSFSTVYHGLYQGSDVAIKQLRVPLCPQDYNYFAAEVNLLKDLRHPRVVLLMGVCTTERLPLMVLEYMANGTLHQRLHDTSSPALDHAEFFRYAHDIALGMNYLHQHKPAVLHLDLKSMNVLLCGDNRAKIADFGFSKFRHDADLKASRASKCKPVQGSPCWMAPELLETGDITTKADVYSFSIVLWEMLTRKQPFENCSVYQVLEKIRTNKRPEIPQSCPDQLSSFIKQCWDPLPTRRPPFRDILIKLDHITFPPDWQALFKEAGIPPVALEDVQSARTIISLVSNTLDTENVRTLVQDIRMSHDSYVPPTESLTLCIPEDPTPRPRSSLDSDSSCDSLSLSNGFTDEKLELSSQSPNQAPGLSCSVDLSLNLKALNSERSPIVPDAKKSMEIDESNDSKSPTAKSSSTSNCQKHTKTEQQNVTSQQQQITTDEQKSTTQRSSVTRLSLDAETLNKQKQKLKTSNDFETARKESPKVQKSQERNASVTEESSSKTPKPTPRSSKGVPHVSLQDELKLRFSSGDPLKSNSETILKENKMIPASPAKDSGLPPTRQSKDTVTAQTSNIDSGEEKKEDRSEDIEDIPEDIEDIPEEIEEEDDIDVDSLDEMPLRDSLETENSGLLKNQSNSFKVVTDTSTRENVRRSKNGSILDELNSKFYDAKNVKVIGQQTGSLLSLGTARQSIEAWVDEKDRMDSARSDRSRKRTPPSQMMPPPILIPENPPPPPPPPPPPAFSSQSLQGPPTSIQTGFSVVSPSQSSLKTLALPSASPRRKQPIKSEAELRTKFSSENTGFMVKSVELRERKELLVPTDEPHPYQLKDLSQVSKGTISSIADILKQAVSSRRMAMKEDMHSPTHSVASSWSFVDD